MILGLSDQRGIAGGGGGHGDRPAEVIQREHSLFLRELFGEFPDEVVLDERPGGIDVRDCRGVVVDADR